MHGTASTSPPASRSSLDHLQKPVAAAPKTAEGTMAAAPDSSALGVPRQSLWAPSDPTIVRATPSGGAAAHPSADRKPSSSAFNRSATGCSAATSPPAAVQQAAL